MLDFLFLSPLQTSNRIFFDIQKSTSPHEKSKRDKDQLPLTCTALRLKSKSSVSCGCAKVLPANQDMSVSDSLQLARQVDPQGLRHLVMVVGYCFGRDVFDLDLCRLVATTVGIFFFGCGAVLTKDHSIEWRFNADMLRRCVSSCILVCSCPSRSVTRSFVHTYSIYVHLLPVCLWFIVGLKCCA